MLGKLITKMACCTFLMLGHMGGLDAGFSFSLGLGIQAVQPVIAQPIVVQQPVVQPYYMGPAMCYAPVYAAPVYGTSVYTQSTYGMNGYSRTTVCQSMPAPVMQVAPVAQSTSFHYHSHKHRRHCRH